MRNVKVLSLDDAASCYLIGLEIENPELKFEIVEEHDLGCADTYEVPPGFTDIIASLTSSGTFDLVVVGHNCGSGVAKAEAIAAEMRDKTIVVWNDMPGANMLAYQSRGFTKFGSRSDIARMVTEMLVLSR